MRAIFKILTLCFSLFVFTNCSQKSNTPSRIEINFQSKGVAASVINSSDIDVIIVNVSGPGMQTIVSHNNCKEDEICSQITIPDIPSGSKRLVQMLIVTKEGTGSFANAIFYGDSTYDILGDTSVKIDLSQADSFTNEADISGQYIPKSTHTLANKELSGSVEVRVKITGKPEMILGNTEIMGGWFESFLLDKVKFKYYFTGWDFAKTKYNDVEIFNDIHDGSGMNIATITPLATSTNNKVVSFKPSSPTMVRENRPNDKYELRQLEQKIVAFLGNSTKHACYNPAAVTNFDGNTGSVICTDQDLTTGAANTCDSYLSWTDLNKSLAVGSASCDLDTGEWEIDTKNLNERERFTGFKGLFTNNANVGTPLVNYTVASRTFSWQADPKVSVNGIHVFTQITSSFDREDYKSNDIGDSFDCKKAKDSQDFNGPFSAEIDTTSGEYKHQITATQESAKSNDQFYMLLCPLAPDGSYYESAYLFDGDHHSQQSEPVSIAFERVSSSNNYINRNACVPFKVQLKDHAGNSAKSDTPVQVNLLSNYASSTFYKDKNCSSSSISAVNVSNNTVIFLKVATTDGSSRTLDASDDAGALIGDQITLSGGVQTNGSNKFNFFPDFSRENFNYATSETCTSVLATYVDSNDEFSQPPGTSSTYFTLNGAEVLKSDDTCTTSITSSAKLGINISTHFYSLYFDASIYNDGENHNLVNQFCPIVGVCDDQILSFEDPHIYNHFHPDVLTQGSYTTGSCIDIKIGAYDGHQHYSYPTDFPDTNDITLISNSVTAGDFYPASGCSPSPVSSVSAPGPGQTQKIISYQPANQGETDLIIIYKSEVKKIRLTIDPI